MNRLILGVTASASMLLSSCGPKMHKVEYRVYANSSMQKILVRYVDKPIFGSEINLKTIKRVVVPTKDMIDTPWRTTIELPAGSLAYAVAGYDNGPKHKQLGVSIYIDGKLESTASGSNMDSLQNIEQVR